ncbi:hypothetical protein KKH13_02835 [Patescibacteria group bacterium]|nr:hypothetical protein [Patescibacteria group bacterium]
MIKIKKLLAGLIIILLSFGPIVGPLVIYAEVTTEVDSGAVSGENQITVVEPSPSPDPSPLVEPAPESTPAAEITTGEAVSVTEAENNVNTTEVNSEVIFKTLNIFLNGDIDLTDTASLQAIVDQAITENPEATTISVSYDGTNIAYVANEILSVADSGNNSITNATDSAITTGDAYSIVSLLNQVNTTIINSQIYLVTINIFGDVNANIILPELAVGGGDTPCCDGQDVTINNQATVSSQINSQAVSGQNTVVAATDAQIESGDAQSVVNVTNVVNTTLVNTSISSLVINVLGEWIGSWLGADEWLTEGDSGGCDGCIDDVSIDNQALVENNITSLAVSGGNNVSAQSGQIRTGNAYSSISLFNFINTSIINSRGFWGFINIFGRLTGNVGTAATLFPESSPEASVEPETSAEEPGPASRETGGLLSIEQSNNVGEYILPGDTVTFNVLVKNPGGGKVYDAKLWLGLTQDGNSLGGGWIHIGDIETHKGVKISSGLVLSQLAGGGEYTGIAKVVGYVGPDSEEITALAESSFLIAAFTPLIEETGLVTPVEAATEDVLGTTIAAGVTPYSRLLKLFWAMLALYSLMLAYEKRERLT